jgi:hypothetical protein
MPTCSANNGNGSPCTAPAKVTIGGRPYCGRKAHHPSAAGACDDDNGGSATCSDDDDDYDELVDENDVLMDENDALRGSEQALREKLAVEKALRKNDREHDQARRDSKERLIKSLAKEDKEHPEGKRKEEKENGSSWPKYIGAAFTAWLLNDVIKPSLVLFVEAGKNATGLF